MKFQALPIEGAFLLTLDTFEDHRGSLIKFFNRKWENIIPGDYQPEWEIRESFISKSKRGVLRGLHFQEPAYETAKWISCLEGTLIDVIFDLRMGSSTYGKWSQTTLRGNLFQALYAPPGLAHGFYVLSSHAMTQYNCSQVYSPEHESGILWNSIDFPWPCATPILSARDAQFPEWKDYVSPFLYQEPDVILCK
jgi:dTDP-4-dehydrorhamnose 3,5-epimerase